MDMNFDDITLPAWSLDDVEVLEAIDVSHAAGIVELLRFLIAEEGAVYDETLDLTLVIHSVVNPCIDLQFDNGHSFNDTEATIAIAGEFCLINATYDKQVLVGLELSDNAVLYLALQEEDGLALEASVCRSKIDDSLLSVSTTRPALSLFGEWEDKAAMLLESMLTRGKLCDTIGSTLKNINAHQMIFINDIEFVDFIRKMAIIGLVNVEIKLTGKAEISIEVPAAGMFLLFSHRTELATQLAKLTI